ncbi:ankyrin repeat-containing domain protein [Coprinopsis sp. MPI-PUGE-AT-0042]|nr:ankyrin repeat-containing domain protein [Coprinopsis sp. MPI-PUGE-AT-0042]
MLKWLSPVNFGSAYEESLAKWTPGTASRFLKSDAFQRWLHGKDIVLCGTGMPGAGKTVLSSLVISTITKPHQTLVAFVYCRYTEPLSIRDILAALARQIMEDHQHLSALLEPLFDHRSLRDMQPTQGELLALLHDVGKAFPTAHYILDGLDEAQPDIQYELVEVLASLGGNLLLTSRPLPLLKKVVPHIIFVDVVAEQEDIASLVAQRIAKCPAFDDLLTRTGSKRSVISKVGERSQGMFLHAALQVEMVRRCTTLKSVMKQLDSMPSKLEEMYALTIERIEKQSEDPELTDLAKRALLWVIYSEEPLTLQELQFAVACTPDNESFDGTALVSEDVLLSSCAGLLSVEGKRNTVRLIHYTAKVVLATILAQTYSEPHSMLSQGCILYLRAHGINDTPAEALFHASSDMPFVSYSLHHWVSHARKCSAFSSPTDAQAFILSCRSFPLGWYPWVSRRLPTMAPSPFHVATFYNILHLVGGAFHVDEDGIIYTPSGTTNANTWPRRSTSPLTFSVSRGHVEAVDWLLTVPNLQVNHCSTNGNTSLHLACIRGGEWTGIAERLLRHKDVDLNLANAQGRTPLMASLRSGNLSEPLVHALLQRPEIDLNRSDNEGATALLLAVKTGRPWILSSILANPDVDVNQTTLFGWTPLMEAVEWGHDAAAHALLDHPSIHVNLKTDDNETVLMIASYQRNESILKRLIALPEIEVNTRRFEDGHTALTLARSEDIMLLLLDAPGIAVNSKSKRGMSAMAIAALGGWERAMARLLSFPELDVALLPAMAITEPLMLEYLDMPGIDINARDIYGRNAIVLASRQGWYRAVKRILTFTELDGDAVNAALVMSSTEEVMVHLLDFPSVQVTAKRRDGKTPLMLASKAGWPNAVQRLLEHPDAGVNIVNDAGETLLMLARTEDTLVNLLQADGLDVNKRTATGETVLMMAAEIGWETAVRVMIHYPGIDLNARDDDGVTALMNAVGEGWDGIVQLFLEDSLVDVNIQDATGRTALMIACDLGYESIVNLLTDDPRADVNARDNTGRTALMTAASEGHRSIVHHLMAIL